MTTVSNIISQAMIYIDDERMKEELASSPALFFRRYSDYTEHALSLLSSPPELYNHLVNGHTVSTFDDYYWKSTQASTLASVTVQTGKTGYDLCSACIRTSDGSSAELIPYEEIEYDSETGYVTFPKQDEEGIEYELDFYKDGEFADLTPRQMRLFAQAVAIVWNERFSNTWLNIQPKLKDSAFETVNEGNYIDKLTLRMESVHTAFFEELRKYEQDNAYNNVVTESNRVSVLL